MTKYQATASIEAWSGYYDVNTRWITSTDITSAVTFSVTSLGVAKRLVAAIEAGAIFTNPCKKTNLLGETYIDSDCAIVGRLLSADLKRLGF